MHRHTLASLALALCLGSAGGAAAQSSPYGVNSHLPSDRGLELVEQAGIGWVRVDFNWVNIERAKGQFDWAVTDRVVREARRRGLWVFATLAYTPGWANGGQHHSFPPHDFQDWYDFVLAAVQRYRGQVSHWGLWNEPNLDHFFRGTRDVYVNQILRLGHQAVKAADPSAKTLGPDLAHLNSGDWDRWLDHVIRHGRQYLDVITHHVYKGTPSKVYRHLDGFKWPWERPSVKKVVERAGGRGTTIWLTETGWRSDDIGPSRQAQYTRELLGGLDRRAWIEKVFTYDLSDDPNWNQKWGLLETNLTPKPAYFAYRDYVAAQQPPPPPPPPPPPNGGVWTWEAERLNHQQGRVEGEGWACHTPLHSSNYMVFGPYVEGLPTGRLVTSARLLVDNTTASNSVVLTLDVFDARSGRVLARRDVRRREFQAPFQYQAFELAFTNPAGSRLEFRTYWRDTSYVKQDRVSVRTAP